MAGRFCCLLVALCLLGSTFVTAYSISDSFVGSNFFNAFDWESFADPTHGRVNYVDQGTARSQNLSYAAGDTFIMRADSRNTVGWDRPGRNSVRLRSWKAYTNHVVVFNVRHMPQGCGTWPAIWEVKGDNWPNGGEVDILEGVNDQGANAATLHTAEGCTMPGNRDQTGSAGQLDCNANINSNSGCGVRFRNANSYGPAFNRNGGGWYAMERSSSGIKVWFWPRNDAGVPSEVRNGGSDVNPRNWGTPGANFPNSQCNISRLFQEHNIVINLTFCGDWAGSVYDDSGCPSSCEEYVNNNPGAFRDAYFDFASIRVYV